MKTASKTRVDPTPREPNVLETKFEPIHKEWGPKPVGGVREVKVAEGKTLKIGIKLKMEEHENLLQILKKKMNAFAWSPANMQSIDPNFVSPFILGSESQTDEAKKKEGHQVTSLNTYRRRACLYP